MCNITELATQAGFSHVGRIDTAALIARPEVREMCAADRCHAYGRSWSCPPACGSLEHCQNRMSAYSGGLIVQSTGQLEDRFDIEGMGKLQMQHKKRFETLVRQIRLSDPNCLPLSAGCCTLCRKCTYPKRPCRFPGKMFSSMEAYGLLVSEVCLRSGLEYYYGPGTMTYTSCVLTSLI